MSGDAGPALPDGMEFVADLGHGDFGDVYRVRRQGRDYAVKILRMAGDRAALTAARREAALLSCVNHPGLARIHEVGEIGGHPYLAMDLVDGQLLSELFHSGPLDEPDLLALGRDVAGTLAAAHRAGVVHRDINPDNILVTADRRTRLVDFGLAARSTLSSLPEGAVVGTPAYIAPEQTGMLNRPVDGRSDLYSLGVVLFEAAAGAPPFVSDDPSQLLNLHLLQEPPDLAARRPDLATSLVGIVLRLLAKDPEDRYQAADELAADLEELLAGSVPRPRPADRGRTRRPPRTPLVGRQTEREALEAAWRRARDGVGTVVLVGGAPGRGKSRLVQDLLDRAQENDVPVLDGTCGPEGLPLAAVHGALEHHRARSGPPPDPDVLRAGPAPPGDTAPDLAALVLELAGSQPGTILHLDDAHWLDSATTGVLRRIADDLPHAPLLVLLTVSEGMGGEPFTELVTTLTDVTAIDVEPLTGPEAAQLVTAHLAGAQVAPDLVSRLSAPGVGNPAATLAYLDAVIDAGLLYPSWGWWVLDESGLEALALPGGLLDLTVRRVAALSDTGRTVLATAAVLGDRFAPELVSEISSIDLAHVLTALAEATASRLVTSVDDGRYAFVHHGVQEAALAGIGDPEQRRLHRRAAVARAAGLDLPGIYDAAAEHIMSRRGPGAVRFGGRRTPSVEVHAVARHCVNGTEGEDSPLPGDLGFLGFLATRAAGVLALAEHAPYEAVTLLDRAHAYAAGTGLADSLLWELTAIAYLRHGRVAEAHRLFTIALDHETDSWRRIRLYLRLSQVALALFDTRSCLDAVTSALRESGRPLPEDSWRLTLCIAWSVVTGALRSRLGPRRRLSGEQLAHHRALAMVYSVGMSVNQVSPRRAMALYRHARPLTARLADTPETSILDAGREMVAAQLDQERVRRRLDRRLARIQLDPYGTSTLAVRRALACVLADEDPRADRLAAALTDHGRAIHIGDLLLSATTLLAELALRGRTEELLTWHRQLTDQTRLNSPSQRDNPFRHLAAAAHAASGERLEAVRHLLGLSEASAREPAGSLLHLRLISARLHTLLEQGEAGPEVEEVAAELLALFPDPERIPPAHRDCWVWYTHACLLRCARACGAQRPHLLRDAEQAVRVLGSLARTQLLRAHHRVAMARLSLLDGDPRTAVHHATLAEGLAQLLDAPLVLYEAAHLRSHGLRHLGDHASAERAAGSALVIAEQQGWIPRLRDLHRTFRVEGTSTGWSTRTELVTRTSTDLNARRLAALQQVSLAAATVLEPLQLARVALDETQRILGAERALLFLLSGSGGDVPEEQETLDVPGQLVDGLVPYLARSGGHDLPQVTDFSTTLVNRVAITGEPLVVTGSAQGATLGSRSAVVHDLRSILVVPLHLKDRLIGAVYLDSRAASGIFTDEDVDILLAITHHVAVALETARAAQLEADVRVARRERDLTELMRSSLIRLSATHDAREILEDTLRTVAGMLGCDACLVLERSGHRSVAARVGEKTPVERAVQRWDGPVPWQDAARPVRARDVEGDTLPRLSPADWVALPLVVQGEQIGAILGVSRGPALDDTQIDVAATLVGQNLVAYRNAHLVTRLQFLAAVDELTGLLNRRRFFELAHALFTTARRSREPVAAVMLDLDHFKQVNDRYGHAVGDEVLEEVATRLRATIQPDDVLGRYGGEEFALVLSRPRDQVEQLVPRLRAVITEIPVQTTAGPIVVTISIGVAVDQECDVTVETLLSRADRALYEAKASGRDRATFAAG